MRLASVLPRGLRRPAVSVTNPTGHILQQKTRPLKKDSTRSGTPRSIAQPSHARAESAPSRLSTGLRRVSQDIASGKLSDAKPRAMAEDAMSASSRQTFRRSQFMTDLSDFHTHDIHFGKIGAANTHFGGDLDVRHVRRLFAEERRRIAVGRDGIRGEYDFVRMREISGALRTFVEHDARGVDYDERRLEERAEVGDALVEALAVPAAAGVVVDGSHPVLHGDGEGRAAVVLRDGDVHDAVGLENVLGNLRLRADFALGDLDFLVVGGFRAVEFRFRAFERVDGAACRECLLFRLAGVFRNRYLLHLARFRRQNHGAENVGMRIAALLGCGLPSKVRLDGHFRSGLEELFPAAHFRHSLFDHLCDVGSFRHDYRRRRFSGRDGWIHGRRRDGCASGFDECAALDAARAGIGRFRFMVHGDSPLCWCRNALPL